MSAPRSLSFSRLLFNFVNCSITQGDIKKRRLYYISYCANELLPVDVAYHMSYVCCSTNVSFDTQFKYNLRPFV